MINIDLSKESYDILLDYQTKMKKEAKYKQFGYEKCINAIIIEYKDLVDENLRLRQQLDDCHNAQSH
jgi:hypothetical protein